jgi:hypothetical protein
LNKTLALICCATALSFTSGCTAPAEQSAKSEQKENSMALLDSSTIELIPGNEGHNLLAKENRLGRAMALASAVKGVTGKKYCSPERTLYRGKDGSDSFWTIQCHDESVYQVRTRKSGGGDVMDCAAPNSVGIKIDCWQPFKNKQK